MTDLPLADLDAFAAVAQARSFRGAATRRGVSPSALSEAVRRLETRLGVRLLNRTTRSVTPTEAGRRLFDRLAPALKEVEASLDAVNTFGDSPTGTLRLNVPVIVARLVMPSIVASFLKAYPGIAVEIDAADDFIDVVAGGYDAGIRYDERLEQDMIAVPIGPRTQRYALAATPDYLDRHGRPDHPRDLMEHACIRHRFPNRAVGEWELERDGETILLNPKGPVVASQIEIQLGAALAGLGVVSTFADLLAPHFEDGTLEPVLPEWWPEFSGPYLYYPGRRHLPAPLRAFIDHVKATPGR